jgi:branched-chain amino acid transport system ATP-binding protein
MILEVENIHAYYGTSHILFGVSININQGEAVCLLDETGLARQPP